jgi:hypothetical protein
METHEHSPALTQARIHARMPAHTLTNEQKPTNEHTNTRMLAQARAAKNPVEDPAHSRYP